jgi:excinuclease ABC subunit B
MKKRFQFVCDFQPQGDQPKAIADIVSGFQRGQKHQTLLGVTGSGKTFTMAHVIHQMNKPALVLAPNKTLAAQLYSEFKELFPYNAVEYFVSYYDYYQPEAYIPSTNTFIEKDSSINDQIDRMRHSATRSLLERSDVIIVSSVSCIYGLGSPEAYEGMLILLQTNQDMRRDYFLRELVRIQYQRSDIDFHRGLFRVRGDIVDVFPSYEETRFLRVEFLGHYIETLSWRDSLTGQSLETLEKAVLYPGSHYVTSQDKIRFAIEQIRTELRERLIHFQNQMQYVEAERIENRTLYDLEMIEQMGFCSGIENYSRYLTGREKGQPPPTLIEYFPKDFLIFVDESHVTIPQIGGMYRGDFMRKQTLVEHGFRLPSALDNRPLKFQEFEELVHEIVYVSATPGTYELQKSEGLVVEMINRPTGLMDPQVEVRPIGIQVEDSFQEILKVIKKKERVLITTLTKRSAEDLTHYLSGLSIKVQYLHSDIDTVERVEILRQLRLGVFDVLVGINLLREGLDIPEVSLVIITDADKEGFLRSERSLIQTIGRAARNSNGRVILYADRVTGSMKKALDETSRRRHIQNEFNKKNGITPTTVKKRIAEGLGHLFDGSVKDPLSSVMDFMATQAKDLSGSALGGSDHKKNQSHNYVIESLTRQIELLKVKMKEHSSLLEFEEAAKIRDEVQKLQNLELSLRQGLPQEDSE